MNSRSNYLIIAALALTSLGVGCAADVSHRGPIRGEATVEGDRSSSESQSNRSRSSSSVSGSKSDMGTSASGTGSSSGTSGTFTGSASGSGSTSGSYTGR
jgi:hypothetical protein